jgi:serine/threonine protein kinase
MSLPRDPSRHLNSIPTTAGAERQALPSFDDGPAPNKPKDGPVAIDQESSAGSIGPYRLLEKIGEGGMGQVWLAEQTAPVKRQVALKLIRSGAYDDAVARRFESERQTLAIMEHPTIAKVFDAGSTPSGQPYLVMEYVPGMPITQYCDQRRLSIRERLKLFNLVCECSTHIRKRLFIAT